MPYKKVFPENVYGRFLDDKVFPFRWNAKQIICLHIRVIVKGNSIALPLSKPIS